MRQGTTKLNTDTKIQIIAHRGLSGLETENTAAAFIAAGNRSYYGIETDIYRTLDGHYILNHDGSSGRICNEDLSMGKSSLAELQSLILNDVNTGTPRNDLRLATPEEYRRICEHYGKVCVPELKDVFTEEEIREILDCFDGYLDKTCFISFHFSNLELIKKVLPQQNCQFLTAEYKNNLPAILSENNIGLDIAHWALTEERVKEMHNAGVIVNCWTVDDPDTARRLIGWGVDQITSNILE